MSWQVVGDIIAAVLEAIGDAGGSGRKPVPQDPAPPEPFVMTIGTIIVFFGCFGCALYLDQWKQQSRVETQPAALASIVSAERKQASRKRSLH